jgi:small conductance mechanosensitive channel
VWIESLSAQTVNLVLRAWTHSADGWAAQTDLLRAIRQLVDAQQISLPVLPPEAVPRVDLA